AGNAARNAWRMHSLKSFFDTLFPTQPTVAVGLYAIISAILIGAVVVLWRTRPGSPELVWAFTVLTAVLIDPHLVDYDLTVLVLAGVLAMGALPSIGWSIVLLYALLLVRAQIGLGDSAALDLTVLVLSWLAFVLARATARPLRAPAAPLHRPATVFDPIG